MFSFRKIIQAIGWKTYDQRQNPEVGELRFLA